MDIRDRLYISTVAGDCAEVAARHGLGVELAQFCTAMNMDPPLFDEWDAKARADMTGIARFTFHAAFNELCPAAIDPLVLDVARRRYAQSYALMRSYGINRMIAHSGYVPLIYFKGFFVERSVEFWREFLSDKPDDFRLYLENVLEDEPDTICEIVERVDDARLRLCLDIGHANTIVSDVPVAQWIERCAPLIGHVHIHNNYRDWDHHNELGDGIIDMADAMRRLTAIESAPTFTIESLPCAGSVAWLEREGYLS
ncbi:MAG: sugar phosphate isomerase/epimerase [Oscillospiraceae bacterium]|jgi:sugar phosphate isomerase/epimerase|nr:sugar phosphate isomerase/epimerase [Oscillospiraceae bacterium]